MDEGLKPSPQEIGNLQSEAGEFNELLDKGELTKSDLQEKLIEEKMTSGDFLELLKAEKEGESLMYLLSQPGTCSHVTVDRGNWEHIKRAFKEGGGISKSESGNEPYISLHVALSNGVTTMASSDWHFGAAGEVHSPEPTLERKPGVAGFVLKPEFLKKIGPIDAESFEDAEALVNSLNIPQNIHLIRGLLNTYMARENVFNGRPAEIGGSSRAEDRQFGPHTIRANDGVRAAVLQKKSHTIQRVPITAEDVAYLFEADLLPDSLTKQNIKSEGRYWERMRIFHPDGSELPESELAKIQQSAKENDPYKRHREYFDQMNVMPANIFRRRNHRSF